MAFEEAQERIRQIFAPAGHGCRKAADVAKSRQAKTAYKVIGGIAALAACVGLAVVGLDKLGDDGGDVVDALAFVPATTGGGGNKDYFRLTDGRRRCPDCLGRGVTDGRGIIACQTCHGTGALPV